MSINWSYLLFTYTWGRSISHIQLCVDSESILTWVDKARHHCFSDELRDTLDSFSRFLFVLVFSTVLGPGLAWLTA